MPGTSIISSLFSIIVLCLFYLPFALVPVCGAKWKKRAIPGKRPFAIAAVYATAIALFQFLFNVIYTSEWMSKLSSSPYYSSSQSDLILNLIINIIFTVIPLVIMAIALYAKADIALVIGVGFNMLGYFVTIVSGLARTFLSFSQNGMDASAALASQLSAMFMIHIPCLLAWIFMFVGAILCARKKGAGIFRNLWHMPLVLSLFYTIIRFSETGGVSDMSRMFLLFATLLQPGFVFALGWWIAHTSDPEHKRIKTPAYFNARPAYAPFEPAPSQPYYDPTPMQNAYSAPVQNAYAAPVQNAYAAPIATAPEQNTYTPPAQSYHEYAAEGSAESSAENSAENVVENTVENAVENTAANTPDSISDSTVESLKKYKSLLDDGIISQAEFDDIKKRLLNN